ncbi:Myb-like HTH transcriptional regulator family protein, putative isoform 1 [Theobroma cacao]|uniref:Myb-like HTH transcriptional regulator family protein, putative isoform 1 n=1 Tax=Theobroma cacao TaxID=3641 RepID=A0A061F4K8_THECC|nr:Myb-like HTH transcriptional regulator family protein, putative isoform 1 [Theobroma cacao]
MNSRKIDCQEHLEQNLGFSSVCNFEYVNHDGFQQPWNMGIRIQAPAMEEGSQQENPGAAKTSNTIMSGFLSPASAFYATERCMGFSEYGCQGDRSSYTSQYNKSCNSHLPSFHASGDNFSIESVAQDETNYELRNTFESLVKSQIYCNQYQKSSEKSYKIPCCNSQGSQVSPHDQSNFLGNNAVTVGSHYSVPFRGNQDQRAYCNSYSSPLAQLSIFQQGKQSSNCSSGTFSVSSGNSVSTGAALASKTRIRWTQDLHDKFVECVKRLGGAEKATPKAILKLMDTEGLTIFHVKSHLQKYRIAKYMPDSAEGKSDKRSSTSDVTQLDVKTGLHLTEALQLQLDVQRRLHEQLEIQRNLQLRIEEQGRQLKMMIDQQQKTNESLLKKQDLDITPFDHDPSFSLEDVEVSIAENSGDAHFPSKIS